MATFSIASASNITELRGKQGADTYNVASSLTIDCDTRSGPNQDQNTVLGNITATPGAIVTIRSTNVRLIPYTGGKQSMPNPGTTIRQGNASAELLCVMPERTGGAISTKGQTPASGWLKVRNVVGAFAIGALTGISADAAGPDEPGWIMLAGAEGASHTYHRGAVLNVEGNWFDVGTTTGARGQTLQLPHVGADGATYYPGVEVETAPGSGVFEFMPNAGTQFKGSALSTDSRCPFVGINSAGLVTIGRGLDNQDAGLLPPAGCRVRVPGIILQSAGSNRNQNSVPHAAMLSRYSANFAAGGTLSHAISTGAWNWTINQAHAASVTDMHACDQIVLGRTITRLTGDRIYAAPSTRPSAIGSNAIALKTMRAGAVLGTLGGWRVDGSGSSSYAIFASNIYGGLKIGKVRAGYTGDVSAISAPLFLNSCDDVVIDEAQTVGKRVLVSACNNVQIKRHIYADQAKAATGTLLGSHAVEVMGDSRRVYVDAVENWPGVANCHPYSGLLYAGSTTDCRLSGAGSPEAPYNAGTANVMGVLFSDGGNNTAPRLQRCWATGLRTGLHIPSNTSAGLVMQNCYTKDASKTTNPTQCGAVLRGNRHNAGSVPAGASGVYDTHFWDAFTSDTTARAALIFTEKMGADGYNIDSGTPRFNGNGQLVMGTGDRITWTWPHFTLGWLSLSSVAVAGTNVGNHLIEYDIDSGNGFTGIFKTLADANLGLEQITATGFRLQVRITCTATNASNKLSSLRIDGTTTLAAQNAALYPADSAVLSLPAPPPAPINTPAVVNPAGGGSCQFSATSLASLERKLDDFFAAYRSSTAPYWVISKGDALVGATYDDPYPLGLDDVSIHEMQGDIPDLNFYFWDAATEMFRCRMDTRLAWLARFTVAELATCRASADQTVKDIMARWGVEKFIDRTAQRTRDEVAYLVSVGILQAVRQNEVFA